MSVDLSVYVTICFQSYFLLSRLKPVGLTICHVSVCMHVTISSHLLLNNTCQCNINIFHCIATLCKLFQDTWGCLVHTQIHTCVYASTSLYVYCHIISFVPVLSHRCYFHCLQKSEIFLQLRMQSTLPGVYSLAEVITFSHLLGCWMILKIKLSITCHIIMKSDACTVFVCIQI